MKYDLKKTLLTPLIVVVLLIYLAQQFFDKEVRINVTLINDKNFPELSSDELEKIFKRSEDLIEKGFGQKLNFKVVKTIKLEDFFSENQTRFGNYVIPPEHYLSFDKEDDLERFDQVILRNTKSYGDLVSLNTLLSVEDKKVSSFSEGSHFLKLIFKRKLSEIMAIKNELGQNMIQEDWEKFSLIHWLNMIRSQPISEEVELLLANTFVVDNEMYGASPHTLIRGGICNGVAQMERNAAVIWYNQILSDEDFFVKSRGGELSLSEKHESIAFVIGHEIGAHIVMNYNDNYTHDNCFAVPPKGMDYKNSIKSLNDLKQCREEHIKRRLTFVSDDLLRMEILMANQKHKEAFMLVKNTLPGKKTSITMKNITYTMLCLIYPVFCVFQSFVLILIIN